MAKAVHADNDEREHKQMETTIAADENIAKVYKSLLHHFCS